MLPWRATQRRAPPPRQAITPSPQPLYRYAAFGLGAFVSLMLFRGAFLYIWALGSAQRTQSKAVHRVLYAPLGFFLTTPIGDLLVSVRERQRPKVW